MKHFLQTAKDVNLEAGASEYRITKKYVELTQKLEDVLVVTYFIFRDESSFMVALDWEDAFNPIQIEDSDDIENIADTYPALAELIRNTLARDFGHGALVQLEDFDDGSIKWFVVSIAGNLDIRSPEDLFEGRAKEAAETVLSKSIAVLTELNENKFRYGGTMWRGFKKGLLRGFKEVIRVSVRQDLSSLFDSSEIVQPAAPDSVISKKSFEEFFHGAMDERQRRGRP